MTPVAVTTPTPRCEDEWPTPDPVDNDEEDFVPEPDDDEVDPGPWDVYADVAEQYGF